jgi:mannitol/fructose-specific phosphotransferase system IIA component (Ntr-type)
LNLKEYLKPEYTICPLKSGLLPGVISELLDAVKHKRIISDHDNLIRELLRRENEFSSRIKPGIALPHTRIKKLKEFVLVVGFSIEGIKHPLENEPVHLFFLELAPDGEHEKHIRLIAQIARLADALEISEYKKQRMTSSELYSNLSEVYEKIAGV